MKQITPHTYIEIGFVLKVKPVIQKKTESYPLICWSRKLDIA